MTKRLGLLLGSLAVFAACGGGGGNNNDATCGNGVVDENETCDDGNTTNGDGCSKTCKIETSGSCGDGTVDVGAGEDCDDSNTVSGDGCSSTCKDEIPAGCGDGTLTSPEECDDHNNTSGDGCDATCHLEGTSASCGTITDITLMDEDDAQFGEAMGDTSAAGHSNGLAAATCDADANIGAGNDQTFKLVITAPSDVEIGSLLDEENFASAVRLTTTACDGTTEVKQSFDYPMGCTDAESPYLYFVSLQPGTYYVTVDGATAGDSGEFDIGVAVYPTYCGDGELDSGEECDDMNTTGTDGCDARCFITSGYHCDGAPSVCSNSPCGNGEIDGTEECDDGNNMPTDGCDATCNVEDGFTCDDGEPSVCTADVGCGNMIIDGTDECDDGGTTNGDGCSSMCKLEFDVTDTEPNDTTAQTITAVNHRIKGSLSSETDLDAYTFTLTAPARVEIESYTTIEAARDGFSDGNENYDCEGDFTDTVLDLYKDGAATVFLTDDDSGDPNDEVTAACSYIGAGSVADNLLPAGTYKLVIGNLDTDPLARYLIDLRITPETATAAAGDLVINEYMANDADADTNCDGVHATGPDTDDEFVEIVNKSTKTLDLTGMTLSDGITVRHTFKATDTTGSMTLAPGKAVVVWGGGAPACPGVTNWFVANSAQHTLALNNTGGDTITLKSAGTPPVVLATASYTANPADGISDNLNPDTTGTTYARHNVVTGHVGNFTPGKKSDNTAF